MQEHINDGVCRLELIKGKSKKNTDYYMCRLFTDREIPVDLFVPNSATAIAINTYCNQQKEEEPEFAKGGF